MAFKVLKRGNKGRMEAQEMVVPASTSLGAQVSRNEEASREESSIIKARVSLSTNEQKTRAHHTNETHAGVELVRERNPSWRVVRRAWSSWTRRKHVDAMLPKMYR